MRLFSPSTKSFHDPSLGGTMPPDAVEVDAETAAHIIDRQTSHAQIDADSDGQPVLRQAPLSTIRQSQISLIDAAYIDAIQQPVHYMGTVFQADVASQDIMTKVLAPGAVPPGFFWLDAGNEQVPMTLDDLRGLAGTVLMQGQIAFVTRTALKAAIRSAGTVDEVRAIVWPEA